MSGKGSARSEEIRRAALELFTRQGYEATTMAPACISTSPANRSCSFRSWRAP
jgi:hypothetical protein